MKFVELRIYMYHEKYQPMKNWKEILLWYRDMRGGGGVFTSEVGDWFKLFSWSPLRSGLGTELLEWRGDR